MLPFHCLTTFRCVFLTTFVDNFFFFLVFLDKVFNLHKRVFDLLKLFLERFDDVTWHFWENLFPKLKTLRDRFLEKLLSKFIFLYANFITSRPISESKIKTQKREILFIISIMKAFTQLLCLLNPPAYRLSCN